MGLNQLWWYYLKLTHLTLHFNLFDVSHTGDSLSNYLWWIRSELEPVKWFYEFLSAPLCKALRLRALWKTKIGRTTTNSGRGVQADGYKVNGRLQCSTRRTIKAEHSRPWALYMLGHQEHHLTSEFVAHQPPNCSLFTLPSVGVCHTHTHRQTRESRKYVNSFSCLTV